ncbi:MAG: FtsX-like permease family protein [Gemmatimonadales bacterium]
MSRTSISSGLRVATTAARDGLRMYWRGALLGALAGVVALAAAAPVVALAGGLELGGLVRGLNQTWSAQATPIAVFQQRALAAVLAPLLGAAAGVLALAAITILVGSAARAGQRASEIGVRRAVGASRRALTMMAMLEASLLAGATCFAGGGFAVVAFRLARSEWPGTSQLPGLPVALVVLAFLATFLLGALFVLLPTRGKSVQVASGPPLELYLAAALLSVGLLVVTASALLSRHVQGLLNTTASATGGASIYRVDGTHANAGDYQALLAALGATPGISMASIATPGVALGLGEVGGLTTDCGECFEANMRLPFRLTTAVRHLVSADTFSAIGAVIVAGRGITSADVRGNERVAVVNRALALRHFQHGEPIGRRLQLDGLEGWYTVVGVVDEPVAAGFGASLLPRYSVYLSVLQHDAPQLEVMLRSAPGTKPPEAGGVIAAALHPAAGMPAAMTEAALRAAQLAPLRWFARWITIEGWAGWLIAALGTLVLVRLWISALIPELGIRRAVGARRRHVLITVTGRAVLAGAGGVACALWFGPGAWQVFTTVIPGLPAWESELVLRYGAVLVAVALVAALPGAWRAMRSGPAELVGIADG